MDAPDSKLVTPREIAALSSNDAYHKLESSAGGLSTAKAAETRAKFGSNFLPQLPTPPVWKKFLLQFRDLFAVLLLIAAAISFLAYILGGYDPYSLKSSHRHSLCCLFECFDRICAGLYGGTCHQNATETGAA